MRYDCRALAKYELNGRFYCAAHYDAKWRFENPEHGPQHDWVPAAVDNRPYHYCKLCLTIKVREGLAQGPCRGRCKIVLRESTFAAA